MAKTKHTIDDFKDRMTSPIPATRIDKNGKRLPPLPPMKKTAKKTVKKGK